jgi:hypothetical protein
MKMTQIRAARHRITVEEHLRVQKKIEMRAYAVWNSSGRPSDTALRDWLQAQDEVIAEFCQEHMHSSQVSVYSASEGVSALV